VWRPGDRLPAEEELTELTPFSLGTVQRALRDLADQGLVVRQHGLGSFVAEKPRELENPWHCRFLGDNGEVLPIYSQALQRIAVNDTGPWTHCLGTDADVMRLDRVIIVNDEFRVFSRFYADRQVLRRLWDMPMDKLHGANFKQVIARQCQLPITDITHMVKIARSDAEASERISLEPGSTGLFMQAVARAGRDLCVYYQEFFIPPNARALAFPEHTPPAA
jgi:GntR family transcriptional regulator